MRCGFFVFSWVVGLATMALAQLPALGKPVIKPVVEKPQPVLKPLTKPVVVTSSIKVSSVVEEVELLGVFEIEIAKGTQPVQYRLLTTCPVQLEETVQKKMVTATQKYKVKGQWVADKHRGKVLKVKSILPVD